MRTPDAVSPRQYPSKNALMAPSARSNKACLNEVSQPRHSLRGFRLGTASAPAHPRSDVATWQQLVYKLYDSIDTTFTATQLCLNIGACQPLGSWASGQKRRSVMWQYVVDLPKNNVGTFYHFIPRHRIINCFFIETTTK